ncbi:MAG: type II toxin-antitoxin system RelE/ParE family toxin [Betaproteobacteria bacterium]|nr:type II toxin-antitoxin system RelE/ParE family toxin [Betaproteobacteria bacterium]MSQ88442.1 type II toxin-antitoxin system RelE/ParE family toxin [Betaproteobacteria bacterium]
MRVSFSPLAESDLEGIGDYIAADNPRRAASFVEDLQRQCRKIARSPQMYRARPELADGMHSCAYGNYVIFFRILESALLVVRILHGAMDISAQFPKDEEQRK